MRKNEKRGKTFNYIILLASLLLTSAVIQSCEKEEPKKNPETDFIEYKASEGEIGSGGGTIEIKDPNSEVFGASVNIPSNALKETTSISVGPSEENTSFLSDTTLSIELLPHGLEFEKPITVSMPYPENVSSGAELSLWYYSEIDSLCQELEIVSYNDNERYVTFETSHFSVFFLSANDLEFMVELGKWKDKIAATVYLTDQFADIPATASLYNSHMTGHIYGYRYYYCLWQVELKEKKFGIGLADNILATKYYYTSLWAHSYKKEVHYCESDGYTQRSRDFLGVHLFSNINSATGFLRGQGWIITFDDFEISDDNINIYLDITWRLESGEEGRGLDFQTAKFNTNKERKHAIPINTLEEFQKDKNLNRKIDIYEIEVDFEASPLSGKAPLTVQFSDKSKGWIDGYNWSFGDGNSSKENNPVHTYQEVGTYTVGLVLNDNLRGYNEEKKDFITVGSEVVAPIANFTASRTNINVGDVIQFTDQSTNNPTSWNWNFGDGGSSTLQNPSHTYSNAGTYTISLTASNSNGSDTEAKTNYITVNEAGDTPVTDFIASSSSVSVGDPIEFTDASSGYVDSWSWNFGDGGTSTLQNPSHTYSNAGTYTVSLTCTNSYGSDTEVKENCITVTTGGTNETGTFTDSRDGKVYETVKIGNQWWMAENLAWLPEVSPPSAESKTESYYYVYDYQGTSVAEAKSTNNYSTYGVLYNWPAALDACPSGWHLPSDDELKELELYLGMSQSVINNIGYRGTDEGGQLKEAGISHWINPNTGATNESGFTALSGGRRDYSGNFLYIGSRGTWWTSSKSDANFPMHRGLNTSFSQVGRAHDYEEYGYSVRCLRD